jgi:integrase
MKPPVNPGVEMRGPTVFIDGAEERDEYFLATGEHARRVSADLAELRALRGKRIRAKVFHRKGSRFLQMRYPDGKGGWRDESTHTENRHDAQALADFRAYEASAGVLPSTATFEQIVDALVHDAEVRGRRVARLARAARALKAKLAGHRAEACDYAVWLKYAVDRQKEVSRDTVHLELAIARRAYRLARAKGLIANVPEFPRIGNLRVRQGFVDPAHCARVCEELQPDFRDAAEFAFLCGPRQMEILTLKWTDVEREPRVIHFTVTKSGRPRPAPYSTYPELAAVIERRAAVAEQLKRAAVITPWVFCFATAAVGRPAGSPLFERAERKSGERGLCKSLRKEWRAAAAAAGQPGLLFHDLRRSAARNMQRAGIPRSVAMQLGGWSDKIYSRYAIGAESDIAPAMPKLSGYLRRTGWHSGGSREKSPAKRRGFKDGDGRSRTYDTADMSRML